jgi:hypothetical protein
MVFTGGMLSKVLQNAVTSMYKTKICIILITSLFVLSCQSREGYIKKMNENTLQPHTDSEPHFQATERPYYYIFQTAHAYSFAALTHGGIELLHCGDEF